MHFLRIALEEQSDKEKRVAELVHLMKRDKFLHDIDPQQALSHSRPIRYDGEIAGLFWPRRQSDGRYCVEFIFIDPKYRGKGIATTFLTEFFADKKGRAYIEPSNHASIALFKKAGFRRVGERVMGSTIAKEFDQYVN